MISGKTRLIGFVVSWLTLLSFLESSSLEAQGVVTQPPKNIVYIMLDDADWFDFGFNSQPADGGDAITPNMDSLRAGGRLLPRFYTASSVCSPTRISVLTGCNPVRFGATEVWPDSSRVIQSNGGNSGLPSNIPQLGSVMKAMGKATGFFGKWHVGLSRSIYRPDALGFDRYEVFTQKLSPGSSWDGRFRFQNETNSKIVDVDYVDRYFADQVLDFIDDHKSDPDGFFVDFCPYTPHYPWTPPRHYDNSVHEFELSTNRGNVLAMMHAVDQEIGRIVDKLDFEGLLNDTLIVITSDNGGVLAAQNPSTFIKGSKGNFLERGMRVPLVAHWPNGIAANSTNSSVVSSYDLLPTFVDLLGGETSTLESLIDGRSFKKSLIENEVVPHAPILWEINGHPSRTVDERAQQTYAIRVGNYKLIKLESRNRLTHARPFFLFDVENDPGEKVNLAGNTALVNTLLTQMQAMRLDVSQVKNLPVSTLGQASISFDPRLDVGVRDMVLSMDLFVPPTLSRAQLVYWKNGNQRATLLQSGKLRWRVTGSDPIGSPISGILQSPVLEPGPHTIVMSVAGYKNDFPRIQLFIDGELVDELDETLVPMISLWSTASFSKLGDDELFIDNIRYHTARRFVDELEE